MLIMGVCKVLTLQAPLSEELVFRGCMMPLLMPVFGFTTSMLLAPWFFGLGK